jgi:hypothetical protein
MNSSGPAAFPGLTAFRAVRPLSHLPGAPRVCPTIGSDGMIMADLGLQLPQEVFNFRPPLGGRREKIKHVAI